jgi:hypothetical protein
MGLEIFQSNLIFDQQLTHEPPTNILEEFETVCNVARNDCSHCSNHQCPWHLLNVN